MTVLSSLEQEAVLTCPFQWAFEKVYGNTYRLRIGGYRYVGMLKNKVIASTYPEHAAEWTLTQSGLPNNGTA